MSQLHKRLEHLVNYSSQLIFVSSDSIANQQRTLSDFLSLQHETTEVSFFTADAEQDGVDYRRIICRQLANHTVGSFVRPLKELLQYLDGDKGHYLVCISQAQHLNAAFLNELWDWVTSCREQQEDLHINVILFAEQIWTEKAQTWLPIHHINKPVLLSSQSIDAVGFDVSALETLMAQKRAFFATDDAHNIIRKKWFIGSVLLVFLLIFITLITLQYPQQIKHFITTGELSPALISTLPAPSLENDSVFSAENVADGSTGSLKNSSVNNSADAAALNNSNNQPAPLPYDPQLEVVESEVTDSLFVSNWPADDDNQTNIQSSAAEQGSSSGAKNPAGLTSPPDDSENSLSIRPTADSKPQDFAVTDIVSVAQLDQKLEQDLVQNIAQDLTQDLRENEPDNLLNTTSNSDGDDYSFDEKTLLTLSQNQILLQLSGIQSLAVLRSYLTENNLVDSTWVYQTQRYGGPWYVVLYKQSFNSINDATSAIAALPESVQQSAPFAKRATQIQLEIRQR